MNKNKDNKNTSSEEKVTRKEAIQKVGKLAALTATTMFFLSPKESQAVSPSSPAPPPTW